MAEDFSKYLFYDIEVFKHDNLVVFKDIDKNVKGIFHNTHSGVSDLIKGKILVGYNNHYYDDYILTRMMSGGNQDQIKMLNDRIIGGQGPNIKVSPEINSLDCFKQIDVSYPSLKKIEGNMGRCIKESDVDFNIERALTEEELAQTIFYCSMDVDTTIDVFKIRFDTYFTTRQTIIDMLDKDRQEYAKSWNTTTISANVLTKKPAVKWYDIRLGETNDDEDGTFKMFDKVPPEAVDLWKTKEKGKVTVRELGCKIEFGFGGLHGVNKNRQRFEDVKLLDVASMYPNIILNTQALGHGPTKIYKTIVEKRIAVKHTDDKLQKALKLVINSCYGLLNNQYSLLYNPAASKTVCIIGQIALYDLSKRLYESGCTLVNLNTDGVAFQGNESQYKPVWETWERDYNLNLELDTFDLWVQKDVNNYVAVKDGKIKVKGGDLGKYHDNACPDTGAVKGLSWCRTNTAGIVAKCLVDKIVYGTDPLDTINKHLNDPILFQFILQAGRTYQGTFDEHGNQYQKVNRVFAAKDDGVTLYKLRQDGGTVRFPDTPNKMLVFNDDLREMTNFKDKIDIDFYYQLAKKACDRWGV